MATKKTKKTEDKKVKVSNWSDMSVEELKLELQKVSLNVRSGKESNTSPIKKIKREIARKLTKNNL